MGQAKYIDELIAKKSPHHLHPLPSHQSIRLLHPPLNVGQGKHDRLAMNRVIPAVPVGDRVLPHFPAVDTLQITVIGVGENTNSPCPAKDAPGFGEDQETAVAEEVCHRGPGFFLESQE